MEAITYLNAFDEGKRSGQKLAKISQDKLITLNRKYLAELKKMQPPVVEKTVAEPKKEEQVQQEVAKTMPKSSNYAQIIDNFGLTVYGEVPNEMPLAGARKIRVNPKVTKHVKGLSQEFGKEVFVANVKNSLPVNEEIEEENVAFGIEMPATIEQKMVEEKEVPQEPLNLPVEVTKEKEMEPIEGEVVRDNNLPSVDDYLQKDRPSKESGIIGKLNNDVENLKAETLRRAELLETLEKKYNELQEEKARRIKELEEEKLSYTATLEGLTQRIIDMQTAIAHDEETLGSGRRVA